jgi:ureidoacrylate peracid hydrolase
LVVDMQNDFISAGGVWERTGRDIAMAREALARTAILVSRCARRASPRPASWGWQLAAPLEPHEQDSVIAKYGYSAFQSTDLDAQLRRKGVRSLIVAGVGTAVCVEATVRQAFELDYYNVILAECCAAYTRQEHEQALQRMDAYCGEVARSEPVFAAWNACA